MPGSVDKSEIAKVEFGIRVYAARLEASAARAERISQDVLGVMVALELGLAQPISAATVSRWESGDSLPSLVTVGAIAAACAVDPGWLAFGGASRAPGPREGERPRAHNALLERLSVEEATEQAVATWDREPLFHLSSPKVGWDGPKPARHHDLIDARDFPQCWRRRTLTVEVEAKAKELAVLRLRDDLRDADKLQLGCVLN